MDKLEKIAREVRYLMVKALRPKESHHIGCSYSIVEILVYLYFRVLKVDVKNPLNSKRDIFILSKGHGALALYTVLHKKGFFGQDILLSYDQDGGLLAEHASHNVLGVEVSTGSLGHGLPIGVGFATSFFNDKKKNRVFVLMSDGELNEGSNWEAIMYAGHHHLGNLTAIIDNNGFQGYAPIKKVIDLSPIGLKISGFGWNVFEADGHDFASLQAVFGKMNKNSNNRPNLIIIKTIKGKGLPGFEGRFDSHYKSVDEQTKKQWLEKLKV